MRAILVKKYLNALGTASFLLFKPEKPFLFQEGQFVIIEKQVQNTKTLKRPYSIATSCANLQRTGTIGFLIKKNSEHGMSAFLTKHINTHDYINISGPLGTYINTKIHQSYLFVSTGSGLAPNLSIIQDLVENQRKHKSIVCIHGEKSPKHTVPYVYQTLERYSKYNNIYIFFAFSQRFDKKEVYFTKHCIHGYVQDMLGEALHILNTKNIGCFICGKPQMVEQVRQQLQTKHSIHKDKIFFEKY